MVYTVKETAEMLKVNPETVKRMIYRGELKAVKVAREWRITQETLDQLLKGEKE